jgi:RimJ/RimL family protein N-acetyltransferase
VITVRLDLPDAREPAGASTRRRVRASALLGLRPFKHQLHEARRALKERIASMVERTLTAHSPTPAFETKVFAKMVQAGVPLSQGLGGFPVLTRGAARLRELRPAEDARSSAGTVPYGGRTDWAEEELRAELQGVRDRFYDKHYVICWALTHENDDRMIGNVRYWEWQGHPECPLAFGTLQFDVAPGHEALAAQAVRAAAELGLTTLGLARVQWSAYPSAEAKAKVVEAAGFVREGVLRAWWYDADRQRWEDEVMYSLTASDLG